MRTILLLVLLLTQLLAAPQLSAQFTLLSNWKDTSLPARVLADDFKNRYNEIWGFEWKEREYAVLGAAYGIYIIDVSFPTDPQLIKYFELSEYPIVWRDFKHKGNYLYVVGDGNEKNTLSIIDFSELPFDAHIVYDSQEFSESCHNLVIDGNRLYLCGNDKKGSRNHVDILDISLPKEPKFLRTLGRSFFGEDWVHDAYVTNDTGYFSGGTSGLFCYDLRNLDRPFPLFRFERYPGAGYNHSGWRHKDGRKFVFADEIPNGRPLHLISFNERHLPRLQHTFTTQKGATPHNPFFREERIYASFYQDGVAYFEADSSGEYQLVGHFDTFPENDSLFELGETEKLFTGMDGCWGVYPFLPSGIILASDIKHGLFVLSDPYTKNLAEEQNGLLLFPNPTKDWLTLRPKTLEGKPSYTFVDNLGKEVLRGELSPNFQVYVGDLGKGAYQVKVTQGEEEFRARVVVE